MQADLETLGNFLTSFKDVNVVHSKTTGSIYYELGKFLKIRIADHIAYNCTVNMSIILPINDKADYIVIVGESNSLISFNLDELKIFINNIYLNNRAAYFTRLKTCREAEALNLKQLNIIEDINKLEDREPQIYNYDEKESVPGENCVFGTTYSIDKPERVETDTAWSKLVEHHIILDLPKGKWGEFTDATKKQIRRLFKLNISYIDAINYLNFVIENCPKKNFTESNLSILIDKFEQKLNNESKLY